MQYGLAQAKARLSELTLMVDAGQDVVLTKHGRPSYRLVALSSAAAADHADADARQAPSGLDDMAAFLMETRSKTLGAQRKTKIAKLDKSAAGFVAQWRQTARY
jgi:prevent-host-death family protein